MNSTVFLRRFALFGALLAIILAGAVASGAHPRLARAVPDTRLTVKVMGPAGVPWTGTVKNWQAFNATWADWGVDSTSVTGSVTGVDPVNYLVTAGNPVAPGWMVVGYASFESTSPDPTCPADPQAYGPVGIVYLNAMHPAWAVCVKVTQAEPLPGSVLGVKVNSQYGPTGYVNGPGDMDFSWLSLGIEAASASGARTDLPAGAYSVIGDNPPLPGMVVKGYYAMETDDPWEQCPQNPADYTPGGGTVVISAQHPIWRVCVWIVAAPPEPDPGPSPDPGPGPGDPFFPWPGPFDPGWFDPPVPEAPQEPASTPVPATPTPASSTPEPTPTATPTTPVPAKTSIATPEPPGKGQQGGPTGAGPTPLPPRTGNSRAETGHRSAWYLAAGLLLALPAAGVAAARIPGRRKR